MAIAKKKTHKPPPHKKRVLILDDHPVVRHGIAQRIHLESDLEICAETATAQEAFRLIEQLQPDVALVDISLAEGNGLDLIKNLNSRGDAVKILVVSGHDETMYAERCIRAGADGYLQKSEVIDKIVDAIRRVAADECYLSDAMTARTLKRILSDKTQPSGSPIASLSDREFQVYCLIGRGLTVNEIAENLFLSHKTIETYRAHLKDKLHLKNSNELTRHAIHWVLEHA